MFLKTKEVSRAFKKVSSVFQESFNNKFQGCFKNVSMKFFCNFVLACISSQLPEQKEGLFSV